MPTVARSRLAALLTLLMIGLTVGVVAPRAAHAALSDVKINEVESNGGSPGDWVEILNTGSTSVDVGGLLFGDNSTARYTIPSPTNIPAGGYLVLNEVVSSVGQFTFGLGGADSARLFMPDNTTLVDSASWIAHASTSFGRCPNGTGGFTTTSGSTKGAANTCPTAPATVKINEVESNGGTPGDWVEIVNTGGSTVDISGLKFRDNDVSHVMYPVPLGTSLAPGAFFVFEEAAFGFGLGVPDDGANLFSWDGTTLLDSATWTAHAASTLGRCPDGTGAFVDTTTSKAAANICSGGPTTTTTAAPSGALPWPGGTGVTDADNAGAFPGNLSGLAYEGSGSVTPGVMWAVRNNVAGGARERRRPSSGSSRWAAPGRATPRGAGASARNSATRPAPATPTPRASRSGARAWRAGSTSQRSGTTR